MRPVDRVVDKLGTTRVDLFVHLWKDWGIGRTSYPNSLVRTGRSLSQGCGGKLVGSLSPVTDSPYRITIVCLGNICRSPMAEVVLAERIERAGLGDRVTVDSAGTGDWHLGHNADPRARATLSAAGYAHDHTARQITPEWMSDIDLLLAMDEANYRDLEVMQRAAAATGGDIPALRMFRAYDEALSHLPEPHPDLAVPDPYFGGDEGFAESLVMIEKAADGIVDGLLADLDQ